MQLLQCSRTDIIHLKNNTSLIKNGILKILQSTLHLCEEAVLAKLDFNVSSEASTFIQGHLSGNVNYLEMK